MNDYTNEDLPVSVPEEVKGTEQACGNGKQPPRSPLIAPPELPNNPITKAGHIIKTPNSNHGYDYICTIDYFVDELDPYLKLIETLHNATSADNVILNIYSYGGSVETGISIVNAMVNSAAHITTNALGICASIGAVIWACGQSRFAAKNATIMFHMPSGGAFGKTLDNEEESNQINQYFAFILKRITTGILTSEQLDKVIGCRADIFVPANELPSQPNRNVSESNLEKPVPQDTQIHTVEPNTTTAPVTPTPTVPPQQPVQPTEGGN